MVIRAVQVRPSHFGEGATSCARRTLALWIRYYQRRLENLVTLDKVLPAALGVPCHFGGRCYQLCSEDLCTLDKVLPAALGVPSHFEEGATSCTRSTLSLWRRCYLSRSENLCTLMKALPVELGGPSHFREGATCGARRTFAL